MRKKFLAILAMVGLLALSACSDTTLDTTTTDAMGATTTTMSTDTSMDMNDVVSEVQTEITDLQTQIQNSAAAQELQDSWMQLSTELTAALASISDDGTIDSTSVQDALDQFQSDLDSASTEIEPELTDAWNTFRDHVESLMS